MHMNATRSCIHGKEISGHACISKTLWCIVKTPEQSLLQQFTRRAREGQIHMGKCWHQLQHQEQHDVPGCLKMCQSCTAQTTNCIWIEYLKLFVLNYFKNQMKIITLYLPCIVDQDFFLCLDPLERREQPELAGNGHCFKLLHSPSSRLLEPE